MATKTKADLTKAWLAQKAKNPSADPAKYVRDYNARFGTNFTRRDIGSDEAVSPTRDRAGAATRAGGGRALSKAGSEAEIINRLKQDPLWYGLLRPFFDIPELRKLLVARAPKAWGGGGWSQEKFEAALLGTKYYQKHNAAQNEWLVLPEGEKKARIRELVSEIYGYLQDNAGRDWMVKNGYNTMYTQAIKGGANKLYEWAEKVASGKITIIELQTKLFNGLIKDPESDVYLDEMQKKEERARQKKRPEEIAEELWQQAHGDYFLNVSKESARDWANRIINGEASFGEFNDFLRKEASTLYSAYAESINNGVLPRALFGPAMGILSSELEMSEEQIVATPSLWGEITRQASVKDGQFSASDWVQYARQLPQWKTTRGANEMAANFSERLLRQFGAVAS